jgi:hypothetical protein
MQRTYVHEYHVEDVRGFTSGVVAIITYGWQLDWTVESERRSCAGRDILVLKPQAPSWQMTWRGQTIGRRPGASVDASWPSIWE